MHQTMIFILSMDQMTVCRWLRAGGDHTFSYHLHFMNFIFQLELILVTIYLLALLTFSFSGYVAVCFSWQAI